MPSRRDGQARPGRADRRAGPGGRGGAAGEHGAAAAELAVVLPAVVLILAGIAAAGLASVTQVRAAGVAAELAREAARGETAVVLAQTLASSRLDARFERESRDGLECVTVRARLAGSSFVDLTLPGVCVCAAAVVSARSGFPLFEAVSTGAPRRSGEEGGETRGGRSG